MTHMEIAYSHIYGLAFGVNVQLKYQPNFILMIFIGQLSWLVYSEISLDNFIYLLMHFLFNIHLVNSMLR